MTGGVLLDSNVLSELRKGKKTDHNVRRWAVKLPSETLFTSSICMMEIRVGILSAMKKNPEFGILLQDWYDQKLKPEFSGRVLPVDLAVAEYCATLQSRRTLPYRDGLIAATAEVRSLTLATRNLSDFEGLGLRIVNPWEPASQ